jgi:hypothetical protein
MSDTIDIGKLQHLERDSHGASFTGYYCPKCLSSNVEMTSATRCNAVGNLTQAGVCRESACGFTWCNVFSLIYYVELTDKMINEAPR